MLACVLLILYFGSNGMFCDLPVQPMYNLSVITSCLRGLTTPLHPPLPDYGQQFYDTLLAWQKNNIYVDYYRDPTVPKSYTNPLPFGDGFDLLKEFSDAKARFDDKTIPLFDFYNELQKSLIKLRDGHVKAISPCLSDFLQFAPFDYGVLKNTSGSSVEPYFVITTVYDGTPATLIGKVITALTWNGDANDKVKPSKAFNDWAEKYSNAGVSPHARFNDALIKLSGPQSLFLSNNPLQDPPTISLTVSEFSPDENGNPILSGTPEDIQLEWRVTFIPAAVSETNVNELSVLCPLTVASTSSSSSSSSSVFRPLTSLSSEEQRIQNESLARVEAYTHTLPGWRPRSGVRFSPDGLKQQVSRQLKRVQEHARPRHSPSSFAGASASARASTRKTNAECDFSSMGTLDPTSDDMVVLCEDPDSSFSLTYIPALQLARMYIGSFNPSNPTEFGGNLMGSIGAINLLKNDGRVKDLIIDVRSNGGGEDIVTLVTLKALFPNTVYKNSEISIKLEDNDGTPGVGLAVDFITGMQAIYNQVFYKYDTNETIADITVNPVEEEFKNIPAVTPATYKRKFSQPFTIETPLPWDDEWPTLELEPQHILLVSDGVVYSNGAVFSKKIRDSNAARVFGYSKYPDSAAAYTLGSVPAFIVSSETMEEQRSEGLDATNLPPTPYTQDMSFAISLDREFSLAASRRNEIMYLSGDTVEDIIPEFNNKAYLSAAAVEGLMKTMHSKYIVCPAGQSRTITGACVCPTGQILSGTGTCVCPEGQSLTDGVCKDSGSSKAFAPVLAIIMLLGFLMQL